MNIVQNTCGDASCKIKMFVPGPANIYLFNPLVLDVH